MTVEYEYHYSRFPHLRAYIDRVGAEQINHRRFLIKEQIGKYYRVMATIKIACASVVCDSVEHAPTVEELDAIELELASVEFPNSIPASRAQVEELLKSGKITGTAHVFYDVNREHVVMVQERREKRDGSGKYYVPWCLFMAKGGSPTWEQMEPDGTSLPFWKPEKRRRLASIMIHEGAKPAAYLDDLINNPERKKELAAHPWGKELSRFEHWGAIGGALAVHRCSIDELRRAVVEGGIVASVVFACDHDRPGEIAAQLFSREWGGELTMLRWDERFPVAWDLADEVPESVELAPMWSFAEPATWATKQIGETSHGRALYALNEAFASEWVHVTKPELYINTRFPRKMFVQKEFDHHCADFSDGGVKISDLIKGQPGRVDTVNYRPDMDTGRHTTLDGVKFFNTHCPRWWEPYEEVPDVAPWLDLLTGLFPTPLDCHNVKRFAATLIARPANKMEYGLLIISETQGVGKTTFADILAVILGPFNVLYVNEQQIVGRFTGWMEHRLIICEEIYAGHSAAAYDKLKPVITNRTVSVEKKFQSEYDIDNFAHVIACSNSLKALRLEDSDRRWFVPEVTERKRPMEFWVRLHHWLDKEEGHRKVVAWAHDFLKREEPVRRGEAAPWTKAKTAVIEAFRSEGMQLAQAVLSFIKLVFEVSGDTSKLGMRLNVPPRGQIEKLIKLAKNERPCLFFDVDVVEVIKHRLYNGRSDERHPEKPLAVRKLAKELGFAVADREHRMMLVNWRGTKAHGISMDQATANGAAELLREVDPDRGSEVKQLIVFSELTLELLGPPSM